MAPSSKSRGPYEVFLSFRGMDVRKNFVGHLYNELVRNGIHTFRDSEELWKGDKISMLMQAIKESRIAIIVFSENYAFSWWCLEEVANIMECKEQNDLIVLPVFYKADPKEVRGGRASYARGLAKHESKHPEKMERWKKALWDAGHLIGWTLNDGDDESNVLQKIVKNISTRLSQTPLDGGIGKTTLGKAINNDISGQFDGSSFLAGVRENSEDRKGLVTLQEQFLNDILLPHKKIVVPNVDRGVMLIQDRLRNKRVLIILDDVDHEKQLLALARKAEWFGNGSRILVTTRDGHLLTRWIDEHHVYEVKALDNGEARELLSKHAFPPHHKLKIREDLVDGVLDHAKGLPLALVVLGSFLCGRRQDEWESALDKLSRSPTKDINDVLKISYEGLERNEKEIFLHIARFFKGWDFDHVKKVLDSCDLNARIGLLILTERSLIRTKSGSIQVHDLIQLMGKDIVNQESDDPERRSRLWAYEDVLDVLSCDMGDCNVKVKAIVLNSLVPIEISTGRDAFTKLRGLELLILGNDFRNLKYMNFDFCKSLVRTPDISWTPNLEELHLNFCKNLVEVHVSIGDHGKLQVLDLRNCSELRIFPKVLEAKNLRELQLGKCTKLERFPDVPRKLEGLIELDLEETAIKGLPASIENLVSLEEINLDKCKNLVPRDLDISLMGGEMPEWVVPVEEGFVSFKASKDLYDKFLGLAFSFAVHEREDRMTPANFEIFSYVEGEGRYFRGDPSFHVDVPDYDYTWIQYFVPSDLWGVVDFGQIDGNYVQFSLSVSTTYVKKWGLRIICKPLEDDLKAALQNNQLMDPALLLEVVLKSIDSEVESKVSSIKIDLLKDMEDGRMSSEEHSRIESKRNQEFILPQGKRMKTLSTSNSTDGDEKAFVD
ncbi:disease resistance protein RPV1-like [Rhodamnia argentea]|uniref:Disease resistance protein RPV1-like n=1 Tax=Rhodamnia argentea TaxID=178133 RepID=A0ABM3H4L6_9MYRT|nr:disease resistance protein RPV1-like [Rhodamnia argentea]